MTNKGLLSIVADNDSDQLLVRARQKELLPEFFEAQRIWIDETADYPYRVLCHRLEMADILRIICQQIDYGNFKNSVNDPTLKRAYTSIWGIMAQAFGTGWDMRNRRRLFNPRKKNASRKEIEPLIDFQAWLEEIK